MSLISFSFAAFYILLFVLYFTCMKEKQWLLLLAGSLVFYAYASPMYLVFLLFSAVTTFLAAKAIDSISSGSESDEDAKKINRVFVCTIVANLLILAVLKYTNFLIDNINVLLGRNGNSAFEKINWILPLGISYYTFIVIGYLVDVKRGVVKSEKNYFKYLLFVSYFPHITQGPISRFEDLMPQLLAKHEIDTERIQKGLYRILVGLSKKLIIAERLSVYVNRVYASPINGYDGLTLLAATFFYAILIYCDFSGYMDMVIGLSGILGIDLAENFDLPYFSTSIPEFWRRWHITLGAWFKDYLYYPILRSDFASKINRSAKRIKNKKGKKAVRMIPTVIGLLITWCATGIWHGASWHYGMWGLYHGVLIILGTILAGTFKKINATLRIREDSILWTAFRIVRTFILVDIGYIFFRAESISDAFLIMKKIVTDFRINSTTIANALLPFTEDNTAISYAIIVVAAIAVLFVCDLRKFIKGYKLDLKSGQQGLTEGETENSSETIKTAGYIFAAFLIVALLLFGIFGQSSFIYMMY